MSDQLAKNFLDDALKTFRDYKRLAEGTFVQISDEQFFAALDAESNSIAVIVKHMAGNMLSRWVDFLTTDGEKPDRHRDMEFVITKETNREAMMARWEEGWRAVFNAVEPLQAEDIERKVFIRGEEYTVMKAITRQLTHYAYHTGQIVFLGKHFKSTAWKSLSIPRNRSAEFNAYLAEEARQSGAGAEPSRLKGVQDFIRQNEGDTE